MLIRIIFLFVLLSSVPAGFSETPKLEAPPADFNIPWTEEERGHDIATRTLHTTPSGSFHVIRLRTAEKPHVHDQHDISVRVLKGRARVHIWGNVTEAKAGDVIAIPRGTLHWAENVGPEPSEVYAVFTPTPYDGKDYREPAIPGKKP